MWEYRARVVRVVDGDTLAMELDLGFNVRAREYIRLVGVWAPEIRTPDGIKARDMVADWCLGALSNYDALFPPQAVDQARIALPLRVKTEVNPDSPDPRERRSFTRYLGTVYALADPENCLNEWMAARLGGSHATAP